MPKRLGNTQIPSAAGLSDIINLKQHKQYVEQDIFPSPENDVLSGLRFDGSSYLTRTPTTAGNRKTWTFSVWAKSNKEGSNTLLHQYDGVSGNRGWIAIQSDYTFQANSGGSGTAINKIITNSVYRDPSSWYHFVIANDTTQLNATDRIRLWVNGIELLTTKTPADPNTEGNINGTYLMEIGYLAGGYFNGYLTNIHFIDGQALDPSHFGYYNRSSRQWKPKKYSGTYGGNGFYLPFNTNVYRYFNGAASVNLSGSPITTFPCTVSCWVNLNDVGGTYGQVINLNVGGTRASIFYNYDDNGGFTGDQASTFIICIGLQNHFATENLRTYPNSGWHHLAVVFKSGTNVTPDVYIDGEFVSATNRGGGHGGTGVNAIGSNGSSAEYFSGYITNVAYFDNYTITQEEVTEIFNSGLDGDITTLSVTQPNSYLKLNEKTGTTVAATLGTITGVATNSMITNSLDFSGNHNDWTPIGFSGHDTVPDSPQNTFATLNPLNKDSDLTISDGNLEVTSSTSASHSNVLGSIHAHGNNKFYIELTFTVSLSGSTAFAFYLADPSFTVINTHPVSSSSGAWGWYGSTGGNLIANGASIASVTNPTTNSILQLVYNSSTGDGWVGFNDVYFDSSGGTTGSPNTNQNPTFTNLPNNLTIGVDVVGSQILKLNFGQDPTFGGAKSPSTTYIDANGIGSFYYQPPDGALALCTANLPRSVIEDPVDYFKAVTYAGDSNDNHSISTVGFQPDLIWIKNRTTAGQHVLIDSVRGDDHELFSSNTFAEQNPSTTNHVPALRSIDLTGFTLSPNINPTGSTNSTPDTFVAWCFRAGGAPSADDKAMVDGVESTITGDAKLDAGTITPTRMSVNAKAGFSIISYTGDNQDSTLPHGLNSSPEMIIVKQTSGSGGQWYTWHKGLTGTNNLRLNENVSTFGTGTAGNIGKNVNENTFGFNQGSSNFAGPNGVENYIAYCWHSVPGYSMLGIYTGNGSPDGPFVYCGFRVGWLMVKNIDLNGSSWFIWDSKRSSNNEMKDALLANDSLDELHDREIDFLSNGFKPRANDGNYNQNYTYIYMAFAEQPFNFTNSR